MNTVYKLLAVVASVLLTACSPIKLPVSNQYTLEQFGFKKNPPPKHRISLLVSQPDAIAGYQTEQMMYTNKPFELSNFAHSAWISSPANMLYPLITKSLQHSQYFYAVASGPDADKTDYRLDTQIIELQQNFITKPSYVKLVANVVLTHIDDNRIIASKLFTQRMPCPTDTPYGGVMAANHAAYVFTKDVSNFVIQQIKQSELHKAF